MPIAPISPPPKSFPPPPPPPPPAAPTEAPFQLPGEVRPPLSINFATGESRPEDDDKPLPRDQQTRPKKRQTWPPFQTSRRPEDGPPERRTGKDDLDVPDKIAPVRTDGQTWASATAKRDGLCIG